MDQIIIKGISLMKSSKYRQKILSSIGGRMRTPSEIATDTGIRLNHVSTFLKELKENRLVECINEETRKGKLYVLTKWGKDVIKELD